MKFVDISKMIDNLWLDIRYHSDYNFVGTKVDGYEEPIAILSYEAALALKRANDEFNKKGYGLIIYDAYRPQRAVNHFVRWASDLKDTRMKEIFYPNVDKKDLFDLGYIAYKSGHSRASTIDLSLYDLKSKKELDMGGYFDLFSIVSHSDYEEGLSIEVINNRKLLRETMLNNGFNLYEGEWWHYTLKDEPYKDTYFDFPVSEEALNNL